MNVTYFRDPFGGYHGVTDESPKGLAGCVCAGRGPEEQGGIKTVKERAYAVKQVQKWTRVKEVPAEWLDAIGYEVRPESEPRLEELELEFVPWRGVDPSELMRDPLFWPLSAVIFAVLWWFTREIFP